MAWLLVLGFVSFSTFSSTFTIIRRVSLKTQGQKKQGKQKSDKRYVYNTNTKCHQKEETATPDCLLTFNQIKLIN